MDVLFFLIGLILYFLPSIVGRNRRNSTAIFWLNLLAGWTFVGWIVALFWALANDSYPTPVATEQHVSRTIDASAMFCSACGKYSAPGARFCSTCGRPFPTS